MKRKLFIAFLAGLVISVLALFGAACTGGFGNTTLSAPTNLTYDGTTLRWDAVENADRYTVSINGGSEYTVTLPSYSFIAPDSGEFTASVTAGSSSGQYEESSPAVMSFAELAPVAEINVAEGGELSWDAVANATAYLIRIDGEEQPVPLTTPSFSGLEPGRHSIQVRPIVSGNNSYYSQWSDVKTITLLETVAADDITYSDGVIKWKYVSGASAYEVRINGNVVEPECTSTEYAYDAMQTDFEVNIKPLGNNSTTIDGQESDAKEFRFLATVTNVYVQDGILRWDAVAGADGYSIRLNSTPVATVTEASYDGLAAGRSMEVQIMPYCEDTTFFSEWSASKSVLLLESPVLQWNSNLASDGEANANVYWNAVSGAAGYTVKIVRPDGTSNETTYGETERAFREAYLDEGTYTVQVKATASVTSTGIYDSMYSAPINIERLPAPTRVSENFITSDPSSLSGFTVTFNNVTGATAYIISRDGRDDRTVNTNQFTETEIVDDSITAQQTIDYTVRARGGETSVGGVRTIRLDTLSSEALPFSVTVLPTPASPSMSGYVYSYGSIAGSDGYSVDVGGAIYSSDQTSYDLGTVLRAGSYNVRVCARGNGAEILASNYSTPINVYRLAAPTNIRIGTQGNSEGMLAYNSVNYATGYYVIFDNDGNALAADELGNLNQRISEQGTTVSMMASANYYDTLGTTYYMSSEYSQTATFIKLSAPTFGDRPFTNTQLLWNAPTNLNLVEYSPTYEVYAANGTAYNGAKDGTSMNISYLASGAQYSFSVKAIGDGVTCINSDVSERVVTINKLAVPEVRRENGQYVWNAVVGASSYVVYIEGEQVFNEDHESGKTYRFTPTFNTISELKPYSVQVIAVGDNGYTTINSDAFEISQEVKMLTTPDFSFEYSEEAYTEDGEIVVTITKPSQYATGYSYTIGGVTYTSAELTCSHVPGSEGAFAIRVYALGGAFDEEGVYYIDSQSQGGDSGHTIRLLPHPNSDSISLSQDGRLTWTAVSSAQGYTIEYSLDGGAYEELATVYNVSYYDISPDVYNGHTLKIRIRALGNGNNIISSQAVESAREWNFLG